MDSVLTVTTPIYLLIAAGFVAVHRGWMSGADVAVLGRFTARFCVPALLFRAISRQPLEAVLNWDYLLVYAAGSLCSLFLVALFARRVLGRPRSLALLQGMGAAGSNSSFIGYPIILQVIGPIAGVALALCTLVENLLIMPLALSLADAHHGSEPAGQNRLRAALVGLVSNPMILAIFAGLLVSALQWPVPEVLAQTVGLAAAAAAPTALFVVGGSLVGLELSGIRADLALIAGSKLLLHPLCVLGFVLLFPPQQPLLRTAAVLFAAMPMMSIYPLLAQRYGNERLCAAALLTATVLSFVTISAVIAGLPLIWLPAH